MSNRTDMRAEVIAKYIIEHKTTVRETARIFGLSKSTVHSDVHYRLKYIDNILYNEVQEVLDYNMSLRHIRGGESTRIRYLTHKNVTNCNNDLS